MAEYYETKYEVENFNDNLKSKMLNPKVDFSMGKLDLPPQNILIPTKFEIL